MNGPDLLRDFAAYALQDGGTEATILANLQRLKGEMDAGRPLPVIVRDAPRHRLDDDPGRCWDCGHPYDAGCGCTCCYDFGEDDHQGGLGPDA
jgi:hypothetical protein